MLYSHVPYHNDTIIKTHAGITDAMIKTQEDFFMKYLPLTLLQGFEKVLWGFTVRGSWRPNITEIFWPQSYGRQRCDFLVLQGCSTGALESTLLDAGFPYYIASISVSNSTQLSCLQFIGFILPSNSHAVIWSRLHASAISSDICDRDVSLPLSLEWPVWSSSSGNNCHAVQRSISSGASVYESILGYF